jgi:caffeoyl-CoA O-methyltransferase
MDIINPDIQQYAERHTTDEAPVLRELNRFTHANVLMPRMLSGHLQGRLLSMISHMIGPKAILEIGTYTGYSALCLAEGLAEGGRLITIDINEELEHHVKNYFAKAGYQDRIELMIGDAHQIVPMLNTKFDLVFIDADKESYGRYFDLVIDRLNLNGFILADNVLWSGKVVKPNSDKDTRAIDEFNKKVQADPRVENVLLPVRDGIMLIRRVK